MSQENREGVELELKGFPICSGIAIGKPFFVVSTEETIPRFMVPEEEIEKEVERYYLALNHSKNDLMAIQCKLKKEGGVEAAAILGSHIEMMSDPEMTQDVENTIRKKKQNTEYVFKKVAGEYEKRLNHITDTFFKERVKDFQDVTRRIIAHLCNKKSSSLAALSTPSIVFAHELAPSDTAEANANLIKAIVTRSGGATSHVAIMARAQNIPFVTNVNFPDLSLALPPQVIVDGNRGKVIINPSKKNIVSFREVRKKIHHLHETLIKETQEIAETMDHVKIRLSANIVHSNEVETLSQYGAIGVGLFRTEYLCLAEDCFPDEETQTTIYKSIVEQLDKNEVVIRTFDIGGDKLGHIHLNQFEKNPNLGCRAIRFMLREKMVFKTQLRAILRASAFGEVKILFPMISSVEELREAKKVVDEAKQELLEEKIPFARNIQVGCMIEVPSAAITADLLARECDFLSLGTNDLIQYCLAVDRGNNALSHLYTPSHPSILRLIKHVIEVAGQAKIPVSLCGEIAADPRYTSLLIGLGLNEFSLTPSTIPLIKDKIRHLSQKECLEKATELLKLSTAEEIEKLLS